MIHYQLTTWVDAKEELNFAIRQLEKDGLPYVVKEKEKGKGINVGYALFRVGYRPPNKDNYKGLYKH